MVINDNKNQNYSLLLGRCLNVWIILSAQIFFANLPPDL